MLPQTATESAKEILTPSDEYVKQYYPLGLKNKLEDYEKTPIQGYQLKDGRPYYKFTYTPNKPGLKMLVVSILLGTRELYLAMDKRMEQVQQFITNNPQNTHLSTPILREFVEKEPGSDLGFLIFAEKYYLEICQWIGEFELCNKKLFIAQSIKALFSLHKLNLLHDHVDQSICVDNGNPIISFLYTVRDKSSINRTQEFVVIDSKTCPLPLSWDELNYFEYTQKKDTFEVEDSVADFKSEMSQLFTDFNDICKNDAELAGIFDVYVEKLDDSSMENFSKYENIVEEIIADLTTDPAQINNGETASPSTSIEDVETEITFNDPKTIHSVSDNHLSQTSKRSKVDEDDITPVTKKKKLNNSTIVINKDGKTIILKNCSNVTINF